MLGQTDNIVKIQNNIIRSKTSLNHIYQDNIITYQQKKIQNNIEHTKHHYNITKQYGKTYHNFMTLQNYLRRHNTIL